MDRHAAYLEHLQARVREPKRALPDDISEFCSSNPEGCFALILSALESVMTPQAIIAIGDELLENLLNESSGRLGAQVSQQLRTNKTFRQAFAFGNYASVDPALLADWVQIFQDLGTTKDAERKSVRKMKSANR